MSSPQGQGDSRQIRVLVAAESIEQATSLSTVIGDSGLTCVLAENDEAALRQVAEEDDIDVILVAMRNTRPGSDLWRLPRRIKQIRNTPVIAILSREALSSLDASIAMDDFLVDPYDSAEIALRIKRALWRKTSLHSEQMIKRGDLLIDLGECEVSVAGRPVPLTFKEYELLRFLASNPGRVFSREALLDEIWGHDYYGGDRTVDVHIRRLRSKIEDPTHTFIETVRNMGYKFRKEP